MNLKLRRIESVVSSLKSEKLFFVIYITNKNRIVKIIL